MASTGGQIPNHDELNGKLVELLAESDKLHEKLHKIVEIVGALRVQPGAQATEWPAISQEIAQVLGHLQYINQREFKDCL